MKNQFLLASLIVVFVATSTTAQIDWNAFEGLVSMSRDEGDNGDDKGGGGNSGTVGTSSPGGLGGAGENEFQIITKFPSTGTFLMTTTELDWYDVGTPPYTVTLKNGRDEILNAKTKVSHISVDFGSLGLEPGTDYSLSIVDSKNKYMSDDIVVSFGDKASLGASLMKLEADPQYRASSGLSKHLMKAYFLEKENWTMEAIKAYNIPVDNLNDMRLVLSMVDGLLLRN